MAQRRIGSGARSAACSGGALVTPGSTWKVSSVLDDGVGDGAQRHALAPVVDHHGAVPVEPGAAEPEDLALAVRAAASGEQQPGAVGREGGALDADLVLAELFE